MTHRRLALSLAAAAIAGGVALAGVPAIAQGSPQATVYAFSLPGSVTLGSGKFSLPGDVVTKKSRGSKHLGRLTLADMVVTITKQAAKGHSVGGLVTVKGTTRQMRGLPVLMEDGTVKIRVAQGRGSRTLVVPRKSGSGSTTVCQSPNVAVYDASINRYVCEPV